MAFPTGITIPVGNVDAVTDSPALARADIKTTFDNLQLIVDSYDGASGIAALDSGGKIANAKLPNTLVSSSGANLTLAPDTEKVNITAVLNLAPRTVAQLNALTSATGDIAFCSDGNGADSCLAVYDGSAWKIVALGGTIN
tara:strand:+ start:115 stop:537 length:423 start_codon:yes stop_codon:yes gene_type:complete